jgi:hypothetical protein
MITRCYGELTRSSGTCIWCCGKGELELELQLELELGVQMTMQASPAPTCLSCRRRASDHGTDDGLEWPRRARLFTESDDE